MSKTSVVGIALYVSVGILLCCCAGSPQVHAQSAQLSLNGGMARNNHVNVGTIGVDLRYLFRSQYVLGVRLNTALQVPMHVDRIANGVGEVQRYDGESTIITMMADIGWRESFGPVDFLGGISVGGTNVAHQRVYHNQPLTFLESGAGTTESAPSFAFGGWLSMQAHVFDGWRIGVGGSFDYAENVRTIAVNHETGAEYRAVFGGPQLRAVVSVGKDFGVPDVTDTSGTHWWLLISTNSWHPFSEQAYNQFNPGVGMHVRFNPSDWTWFGEAAVYQFSLSDRALYAGGGLYRNIVGDWLKVGVFAGLLSLNYPDGFGITPAISPRITADTEFGSFTVLFIPVWTESAFGFTVHLPLM